MKPGRVIEILEKMKRIHEDNPNLAMTDITNAEIIESLEIGRNAIEFIIEMAREEIRNLGIGGEDDEEGN